MTQQELQNLLKDMSLKEKVNQLLQITGGFFTGESILTGPVRENGITEESVALTGTIIGQFGAEEYKRIQKEYMEKHPHGIPFIMMLDVINGFRTVFPIPLGQGAAFDPELAERCAAMAAKESAVSGVHLTFSPMVDLVRDARWGRVMESTGEDPKLNSDYAAAIVKGYQGETVAEKDRIAACVKHFAGYGAPVAGREYNNVEVSENTLRGYYLPAYEAAIKAGAEMVMTSFNTLNGIPSTGNKWLMREVLREEMGFDGVVISDWAAIEELINHGFAVNREEAGKLAMEAGVDIDMMTGIYSKELETLVEDGQVPEELLDEAVFRVLQLKNKLGLFENPYKDADPSREKEVILCKEHRKLAQEAAEKSFVLLENEGILPLQKAEKTAFIGPFCEGKEIYGAWSIMARPEDTVSVREAAASYEKEYSLTYAKGSHIIGAEELYLVPALEEAATEESKAQMRKEEEALLEEAVKTAKEADKVVLFLGEHRCMTGEGTSRTELLLPRVQRKLLQAVAGANDNVAVVLFTGRPLDLREVKQYAKAVLTVWMPGTEGGTAIMRTLTGEVNPGGKLPMSFPYCTGQEPLNYNEYFTGRPYEDGEKECVYRSNYRDCPNAPLYPFGYGISYTKFVYSGITLDKEALQKDGALKAEVTLKNTGGREGTETVQLYIRDCAGSVVRPKKELKAYKKITLAPGQEQKAEFTITEEMLRFCKADMSFGSEPGEFMVFIGTDSSTKEYVKFTLE